MLITSGKAWPKALSGLLQGVDLMEAWRLGKKSAWWNAEGLTNRIINPTPYTSIPSLIFGFFVMGCKCGSMCAKIWKNNPHSQNAIVEPSELDKIETFKFQPFISISFASVLNHPIHSHVNLSCPVSLAMKRVVFESVEAWQNQQEFGLDLIFCDVSIYIYNFCWFLSNFCWFKPQCLMMVP